MYKGGLPLYPKSNSSPLILKICDDRFVFHPTIGASWFKSFSIPYSDVCGIDILQRQAGLLETAIGGLDSLQLNTKSVIELSFMKDTTELKTRWQMLSGLSASGQAQKASEMLDLIRSHGITNQFKKTTAAQDNVSNNIPTQIEKLAGLRDRGLITEEEYNAKKAELLQRM